MNYSRQEFVDEKTVLKAEMLDHMEEGIVNNEKDNFLFTYGQNISNNLYKKEALRVSSNDLIEALLLDKSYLKVSNKVPSLEDFYNGFTIGYDFPFNLFSSDDPIDDKFTEYMEYISSYYQKIGESVDESLGELYAELPLVTALTLPIKIPLVIEAPSSFAPEIAPSIIEVDPDFPQVSILSIPGIEGEMPLLLFVLEDLYDDGALMLEKGTYAVPFLYHIGISLYISGFSFEEEKEEEELPIIESYGNTITWDGNINGLTWFSAEDNLDYLKWYKVSNNVPSYEELLNGYKIRVKSENYTPETTQGPVTEEKEVEIDSSKVLSDLQVHSNFYLLGNKSVIIVFKQAEGEDSIDASPGTYLLKFDTKEPPYYARGIISSFTTYGFNNWEPIVTNKKTEQGIFLYISKNLFEGDVYLYKTPSAVESTRVSYNELKTWVNEKKHILISNPDSTYFSSVNIYDFSNENFGKIITQFNIEGSSIELVPIPLFTAEYVGGES